MISEIKLIAAAGRTAAGVTQTDGESLFHSCLHSSISVFFYIFPLYSITSSKAQSLTSSEYVEKKSTVTRALATVHCVPCAKGQIKHLSDRTGCLTLTLVYRLDY